MKFRLVNVGDIRCWGCSVGRMLLEMDALLIGKKMAGNNPEKD